MKSYTEVVKERYNGIEKNIHLYDNMYSMINPIGFYADKKLRNVFYVAFNYIKNNGVDITQLNILDVGCGKGLTTRFFCELTGKSQNIYGFDLSENRIQCAIKMNSSINYKIGDIVNPPSFSVMFDVITALDVFMHLNNKDEIILALSNINKKLKDDGYFIWYDAYATDHFNTTENQDHSGFHPKQMIELAKEAGFKKMFQMNVFKKIFWKYHSLYLIKKIPTNLINIIEKTLPGSPGNMMIIFKKNK